jgi:hypothetical protein
MRSESFEESSLCTLQSTVDEHQICCHRECRTSQSRRDPCGRRLNDPRTSVSLDQGPDALDSSSNLLARAVSKSPHGPNDVMGARRLFGGYVTTGVHRGDEERNERIIRIEAGQRSRSGSSGTCPCTVRRV